MEQEQGLCETDLHGTEGVISLAHSEKQASTKHATFNVLVAPTRYTSTWSFLSACGIAWSTHLLLCAFWTAAGYPWRVCYRFRQFFFLIFRVGCICVVIRYGALLLALGLV